MYLEVSQGQGYGTYAKHWFTTTVRSKSKHSSKMYSMVLMKKRSALLVLLEAQILMLCIREMGPKELLKYLMGLGARGLLLSFMTRLLS